MRHRQRDVIGDAARDGDVMRVEGARPLRPELQAEQLIARGQPDVETGSIPRRVHALPEFGRLQTGHFSGLRSLTIA